jgi:hypothetical protein
VCHTTSKEVPKPYLTKVRAGITAAAKKWDVQLHPSLDLSGKFKYEGKNSTRFGNRAIEEKTKNNYEGCLRQFWRFCVLIGDYESLLPLLSPRPNDSPAVNVMRLDEFLRFKRLTTDMDLRISNSTTICKDVLGKQMTVEGCWKAPKNALIFRAGVHNLHLDCNHVAEYEEPCDECRGQPEGQRHKGCRNHNGRPRLYRKGDPTSNVLFTNCIERLRKKDIAYEEKGSSQLLPSDLRLLCQHLLSTQSIVGLQTWVIIIVATILFLRHDEFHDIEMEHFKDDLFQILPDRVNSLALAVFGKCDKRWLIRRLVADHEYPELSPVGPLLVYTHLIGIKGGYMFPTAAELKNPPADGIYKTTIDYSVFMDHLQNLCELVLPPREDMKIGCQTFRKTGYCMAIFGEANSIDLMKSARHSTAENSSKYRKDAVDLYRMHKENPTLANNVRKWSNICIEATGNSMIMAACSGHKRVAFDKLGDHFVRNILGIPENHVMARNQIFLVRAARENVRSQCPSELFRQFKETLNTGQADELQKIVDTLIRERLRTMLQDENTARSLFLLPPTGTPPVTAPPTARPREEESVAVGQPARKKARGEKNDLPERLKIKDSNTLTKINIMKGLWDNKASWEKPLTPGANTFQKRFLNPAMSCLHNHFAGSVDAFVEKYPAFEHTKFPEVHCSGKGTFCSPKVKNTLP